MIKRNVRDHFQSLTSSQPLYNSDRAFALSMADEIALCALYIDD